MVVGLVGRALPVGMVGIRAAPLVVVVRVASVMEMSEMAPSGRSRCNPVQHTGTGGCQDGKSGLFMDDCGAMAAKNAEMCATHACATHGPVTEPYAQ